MKILLVGTTEETQLYAINAITKSLSTLEFRKPLLLDLVFIAKKPINNNFIYLEKQFNGVYYSYEKNKIKLLKKNAYDFLIAFETTFKGLYLSRLFNAQKKVSFNRFWGLLSFNRIIKRTSKKNNSSLHTADLKRLMKELFGVDKEITPSFFLEEENIQKNDQMTYWIFKTSHSMDLDHEKYILLDFSSQKLLQKNQLPMIAAICDRLLEPFKGKIIFVSGQPNLFHQIELLLAPKNRTNFLYCHQSHINVLSFFPLYKHALLVVTNKMNLFHFLTLLQKPVYLFHPKKKRLNSFFSSALKTKKRVQTIINLTVGEINYMLKSLSLNK